MTEARRVRGRDDRRMTAASALAPSRVWQLADGQAAVSSPLNAYAVGDRATFCTEGQYVIPKVANVTLLDGGRAYWDRSAGAVTYRRSGSRDYYLGRVVGDAAHDATTCTVNLNVDPPYDLDLARDACISLPVGTMAAGGFGPPVRLGGAHVLRLTSTNESQKVDLISRDGISIGANAIIEGAFCIVDDGGPAATRDFAIGVASSTHPSDFQSISEFVAVSTTSGSTSIYAQSDDGVTDVPLTNTTVTYAEGASTASRVEIWLDLRDHTNARIYVNGVRVLSTTTFTLSAAAGPLYLICHLEKTLSADTYEVCVDWLRARHME